MEEEIIESVDPLIKVIASKFYNVEKDDLLQAGRCGALNAYKHYDKNSGVKFSTFAYSYIFGEMYNLSLKNKNFKINRDNLKLLKLIEKTKVLLTQKLNKEVSVKDISNYLNIDEDIINNVTGLNESVMSLDQEEVSNNIIINEDNDLKIDINSIINNLDYPEKDIIMFRYFKGLTQSEIATILNMSQVSVSRCEKKTLSKIKKEIVCE